MVLLWGSDQSQNRGRGASFQKCRGIIGGIIIDSHDSRLYYGIIQVERCIHAVLLNRVDMYLKEGGYTSG